jgi:hypothetical protein
MSGAWPRVAYVERVPKILSRIAEGRVELFRMRHELCVDGGSVKGPARRVVTRRRQSGPDDDVGRTHDRARNLGGA